MAHNSQTYTNGINHFTVLSPLILAGIQVAFEIPERTELETAGDVEVCAVVVEGVLAREAIVTVASRDGFALGTSP